MLLYETDQLILEYKDEVTRLRTKVDGDVLLEEDFYGNPDCGLIDSDNNWAIIAGEHLTIWTPGKSKKIIDDRMQWVHSLRVKNSETVEILIDPWGEDASVWEIHIHTFQIKRIRDFNDYQGKEYTENVIW